MNSSPAAASPCRKNLRCEMDKASAALDFERAAIYRDRLVGACRRSSRIRASIPAAIEEADVFAVHQAGGYSCVEVFSSAPDRTGATAPIFRKPTARSRPVKC